MTDRTIGMNNLGRFARDEDGGMTVLALFLTMGIILAAGLAIDLNNAVQSEVQLQGTADAAGHAGIVELYKVGPDNVEAQALAVAELNMPESVFGKVLVGTDVEVGSWDRGSRTFTPNVGEDAVRVVTRRLDDRNNALATFLLRLVGQQTLQLNTQSVWAFGGALCPGGGQGFFAMGEIDMQSGNDFNDKFCLHGELGVTVSTDNNLEYTTVTMPEYSLLTGPTGQGAQKLTVDDFDGDVDAYETAVKEEFAKLYEKNPGLKDAHHTVSYADEMEIYFGDTITAMTGLSGLDDPTSTYDYLKSPLIPESLTINTEVFDLDEGAMQKAGVVFHEVNSTSEFSSVISVLDDGSSLIKNAINHITCSHENGGNTSTISFANDVEISDLVIVTNCDVVFGNGSSFSHGAVITTSTSGVEGNSNTRAIEGPSGSRFGDTGYCPSVDADGNEVAGSDKETIVASAGDVSFASGFESHGVNMVVLGDVHNIAANPDSGGGINLYVNGDIDITAGGTFGYCGKSPNDIIDLRFIRMVM